MDNYKHNIPDEISRNPHYIYKILNWNTWSVYLNGKEKEALMNLLPAFPTNTQIERQKTLKMLFEGQVFGSQNPGQHFIKLLKDGTFDPKISQYIRAKVTYRYKEFHRQLHQYQCNLLREIVLMREQTLQQAHRLSCYTPKTEVLPKFEYRPQLCPLLSQVLKRHKRIKCSLPSTYDTNPTIQSSWHRRWEEFKTRTGELSSSNESTDESINQPSSLNYLEVVGSLKAKKRLHKKVQLSETCYSLGNCSSDEEDQPCTVLIGAHEPLNAPTNQITIGPRIADVNEEERMEYERFLKGPYKRLLKTKRYQSV